MYQQNHVPLFVFFSLKQKVMKCFSVHGSFHPNVAFSAQPHQPSPKHTSHGSCNSSCAHGRSLNRGVYINGHSRSFHPTMPTLLQGWALCHSMSEPFLVSQRTSSLDNVMWLTTLLTNMSSSWFLFTWQLFPISLFPHLILVKNKSCLGNNNALYILHIRIFFKDLQLLDVLVVPHLTKNLLLISKHTKEYHIISNDSTNL